jgi:hypothetical protein
MATVEKLVTMSDQITVVPLILCMLDDDVNVMQSRKLGALIFGRLFRFVESVPRN